MTSKPASRRARATTLAPRSWPSRPGLATSTRGATLENDRLLELAPGLAQHVGDLAQGAVGLDGVDQHRHQVGVTAGGGADLAQEPSRLPGVTLAPDGSQALQLPRTVGGVHLVPGHVRRRLPGGEAVDADHHPLAGLQVALL